jgi:hypothetical protein
VCVYEGTIERSRVRVGGEDKREARERTSEFARAKKCERQRDEREKERKRERASVCVCVFTCVFVSDL